MLSRVLSVPQARTNRNPTIDKDPYQENFSRQNRL